MAFDLMIRSIFDYQNEMEVNKINSQFSILVLNSHKNQIPGPGKCLTLPIGLDAHDYKTKNRLVKLQDLHFV